MGYTCTEVFSVWVTCWAMLRNPHKPLYNSITHVVLLTCKEEIHQDYEEIYLEFGKQRILLNVKGKQSQDGKRVNINGVKLPHLSVSLLGIPLIYCFCTKQK